KSCVWIWATDGKKVRLPNGNIVLNVWTGSGSLIDREHGLVLTNQHLANETCTNIFVIFPAFREDQKVIAERNYYLRAISEKKEKKALRATLVKADRNRDLAVIKLEKVPPDAISLRLAKESVSPGHEIFCIGGSPRGHDQGMWILSTG